MKSWYTNEEINLLTSCTLCPRDCSVDRFRGGSGYCGTGAGLHITSICIHRGEEPVISGPDGICNVFFAGCNMRCIYCQNHEISRQEFSMQNDNYTLEEALDTIEGILRRGIKAVGFVSPSHLVPQMKAIIRGLHKRRLKPVIVYNSNGYDRAETIDSLDSLVDVYLPDFKYYSSVRALQYSGASDYPEAALKAIKRMYYQKGSRLITDDAGRAESGMLIRHLVLPGHAEDSKKVLRTIAEEISSGISISLMSQYHPTDYVKGAGLLGRTLYMNEYEDVVMEMESLGFRNGWLQDLNSNSSYRPDFSKEHPFEIN